MKKILICDDESEILELLEIYLLREGYAVRKATDGQAGMQILYDGDIDMAIVDIMMPKKNGYELIESIRKKNNIPIIVISAKNQDEDKIRLLDLGADDYITKPFNPLEVISRVNAQMRRRYKFNSPEVLQNMILKSGNIVLDTYNINLKVNNEGKEITSIEYGILKYLMENQGRILTKNQIFANVWKEEFLGGDNTIMVHISRIRDKIEEDPRNPKYLKTIRGLGYRFEKI